MEAALCLGYGPLPSISLPMPSSSSTKLHFRFNHSSISVSSGGFSNRRRCNHHFYSVGPLALDRSNSSMASGNEKGIGGKVVRGAVGASLALACALTIIGCSSKIMNLKAIAGPRQQVYRKAPSFGPQFIPQSPGKVALKSLLDITANLASKEEIRKVKDVNQGPPSPALRNLPPSKDQIDGLKEEAVSLIKKGQPDEALDKLKQECKRLEMSGPETAYYINLVLVEILICQGKYEEAFEFMNTHVQKMSASDVRPTLYKAILCTMLDKEKEAEKLWKKFSRSIGQMSPPN
ncbi:hypothetical protein REPUB_Repub14bG0097600 [Reevesia pubescens]